MRILIIGGPRTGKTTYAATLAGPTRCTDLVSQGGDLPDLLDLPVRERWSAESQAVAGWFDEPGPWVIEGVVVPRALRKWKEQHPGEAAPCDEVHILSHAKQPLSTGQQAMGKGVRTVYRELESWLRKTATIVEVS